MQRAAIYARFSSVNQNDRSIDDQVALGREIAARHNMAVAGIYADRAISGSNAASRPDFQRLMADAAAGAFTIIIVEDIDRFSRDQADWHTARKRLDFLGVKIITSLGPVGRLDGSLRALMAEHFIESLIIHTRRGMVGRIKSGFTAGGLTFGYDLVQGQSGARTINETEAEIVRRIFSEYVAGERPMQIIARLNAEHIAPPRGRDWTPSTLLGNPKRGYGLLCNPLYDGRLVWNRVRMLKVPDTDKRISKDNPPAEWLTTEVEALRIIERTTFAEAQRIRTARGHLVAAYGHRSKHLLSGMLECARCGGTMRIKDHRRGITRITCSRAASARACEHRSAYPLGPIESRVVAGLQAELTDTRRIELFIETYRAERQKLARNEAATAQRIARRLGEVERELARFMANFGNGTLPIEIAGPRITELHSEKQRLLEEQAAEGPANVVALHPAAVADYRRHVKDLAGALRAGPVAVDGIAANALRKLIARVTVGPSAEGGAPALDVAGRLAELTGAAIFPTGRLAAASGGFRLVAGGRYQPKAPEPYFLYRAA